MTAPAQPAHASPAQSTLGAPVQASAAVGGADRDWLNARFAEIAGQIERSLKENRPERALSALGQRFDKLESSLATVMTAVRTSAEQGVGQGASQAALQTLDAQVGGLKTQVEAAVLRLERLDALKGDIAAISQSLGALDRLEQAQTQVAAQLSGTRSDIDHLSRSLEQQKAAGAGPAMALAGGQSGADPRIDALQNLMESHVNERHEGEAATVAALNSIQSAIDQLAHRMSEFEEVVASAVLGGLDQPVGEQFEPQPNHLPEQEMQAGLHPGAPRNGIGNAAHLASELHPPVRPVASGPAAVEDTEMPEPPVRGRGAPRAEAPRRGVKVEPVQQVETAIPRTRRGLGNIIRPDGEGPVVAQAEIDEEHTGRGSRRGTSIAAAADHGDMLDAARRSASRAAPAGEDSETEVDVEAIAARLPGQKRPKQKGARGGFFTFEKAGSRPLVVVGLVALLAAGAGVLYGTLAERPQPVPVRMEKPKAPLGKVGSLQPTSEGKQLADAGNAVRPDMGDDLGRTGINGRGSPDVAEDTAAADMRAADLKEAVLSVMKPSADTEVSALHTSSSLSPARGDGNGITTGILIDSGAPCRRRTTSSATPTSSAWRAFLHSSATRPCRKPSANRDTRKTHARFRPSEVTPRRRARGRVADECRRLATCSDRADVVAGGRGKG